jgi:tripartite-type tricarboxylate transporter receptor subunit TctC
LFKHLIAMSVTVLLCNSAAFAAYPESPVSIVVPFPAGQAGDLIARIMGVELAQKTGQSFIIENRPGAGGRVGTASVARAKSDGYTLLLTSSGPFAIAPALYPETIQYDPVRDFAAVADMGSTPQVIAVSNASGIQSMAELLRAAKVKDLSKNRRCVA